MNKHQILKEDKKHLRPKFFFFFWFTDGFKYLINIWDLPFFLFKKKIKKIATNFQC